MFDALAAAGGGPAGGGEGGTAAGGATGGLHTKIIEIGHHGRQGVDLGDEMKAAKYCLDPPGAGFR